MRKSASTPETDLQAAADAASLAVALSNDDPALLLDLLEVGLDAFGEDMKSDANV